MVLGPAAAAAVVVTLDRPRSREAAEGTRWGTTRNGEGRFLSTAEDVVTATAATARSDSGKAPRST